MLFRENLSWFEMTDSTSVFLYQLLVEIVFVIPPLLFLLDKACFKQNFYMMTDRGLGKINDILDLRTLATSSFFRDMLKNAKPVSIAQRF